MLKENSLYREGHISDICVSLCKGSCCDPWWGIIFYSVKKERGLNNFKKEITDSIVKRVERIKQQYITNEKQPKPLFNDPERYNVNIENITQPTRGTFLINLRAMFAFRCTFLTSDKRCSIHPTILKTDIRPPHCDELGALNSKQGQKEYCRIIEAFVNSSMEEKSILSAVEFERNISKKHYDNGFDNIEETAKNVIQQIKEYLKNSFNFTPDEKIKLPGRNSPCHCGSGKKYKKCHGK